MTKTAICFDLDGTLTTEEILPRLSVSLDLHDEIDALTSATLAGTLPFESSFRLRVRLLRDLPLLEARAIIGQVELQPDVLSFIQGHSERCFILTGNLDVWLEGLKERIGCEMFSSSAAMENDVLIGVEKIIDKGSVVESLRSRFDRIVAVGDGMNDVPMFEKADLCVAYGGVHDPALSLLQLADLVTYHPRGLCNILNTL